MSSSDKGKTLSRFLILEHEWGHKVPNQGRCTNINTCLLTKNLSLKMVSGECYAIFLSFTIKVLQYTFTSFSEDVLFSLIKEQLHNG